MLLSDLTTTGPVWEFKTIKDQQFVRQQKQGERERNRARESGKWRRERKSQFAHFGAGGDE